MMQVNVESMFLTSRYAIPAMIESGYGTDGNGSGAGASSGQCGAIVNVASIAAIRPRGLTAYTTSKGAVVSLTMAMAVDHGKDGIRVNCVAPGPVFTPMVSVGGMSDEARERRRTASVLGIEGSGWDVGHAVRFLLKLRQDHLSELVARRMARGAENVGDLHETLLLWRSPRGLCKRGVLWTHLSVGGYYAEKLSPQPQEPV